MLVGGNIGHALSAQVDESTDDTIHVVETSSFQLETAETFAPWIAVLLNFSADHLDRHESIEEYAAAKARIFEHQAPDGWAVLNADDPAALSLGSAARGRRLLFSLRSDIGEGIVVSGNAIVSRGIGVERPLVPLASIRLIGPHLVADVVAATAVAWLAGVTPDAMTRAVEGFTGLEHALEPVVEVGGVRFVNDSKATNVESARRAIESFGPGVVAIMGGRFKGGDLSGLAAPLEHRRATVVAIGEARPLLHEALGARVPVRDAADMRAAVRTAFGLATPGDVVVLAPACASFDMFRDYAERGRVFKQEAMRLQEEWNGAREQ